MLLRRARIPSLPIFRCMALMHPLNQTARCVAGEKEPERFYLFRPALVHADMCAAKLMRQNWRYISAPDCSLSQASNAP